VSLATAEVGASFPAQKKCGAPERAASKSRSLARQPAEAWRAEADRFEPST